MSKLEKYRIRRPRHPAIDLAVARRLRSLGWTQKDLARRAGLALRTVHRIVNTPGAMPAFHTLCKLATALGCTVTDLRSEPDDVGGLDDGPRDVR